MYKLKTDQTFVGFCHHEIMQIQDRQVKDNFDQVGCAHCTGIWWMSMYKIILINIYAQAPGGCPLRCSWREVMWYRYSFQAFKVVLVTLVVIVRSYFMCGPILAGVLSSLFLKM